MGCEHCIDPDGQPCMPSYGVAPHECFYKIPGAVIGQSRLLPRNEWPDNFIEDEGNPGHGIYWCAHCGEGKPMTQETNRAPAAPYPLCKKCGTYHGHACLGVREAAPVPASTGRDVDAIADYVADNWPMRKYSLEEIEAKLREIPAPVAARELDADAERRAFDAAYLAEFGDPAQVGLANGLELAWLGSQGRFWRAARNSARASAESAPVWQSIETVPGDMKPRLYLIGRFCVQGFVDVAGELQVQSEVSPHWRKMRGKPTHWMPLPAAPADNSKESKQ